MSSSKYILIDRDSMDTYLKELGKLLHKRLRNSPNYAEIIIVGGASILLNYHFRFTTADIDCTDNGGILMNELIMDISNKYNLPPNWINTDFKTTASYSSKLRMYSTYYKTYGNGALQIRTIKDEYLVAMKIVSGRRYKNDYSDIVGVIKECYENGKVISLDDIDKAIKDLYDNYESIVKSKAYEYTRYVLENIDKELYEEVRQEEMRNRFSLIEIEKNKKIKQEEVEYILDMLNKQ